MARTIGSTKAKSRVRVLEAAVNCLGSCGHKGTTFQSIAKEAGVSPALVVSHFGTAEKIFSTTLLYIIEDARRETEAALAKIADPAARLRAYVEVSFAMIERSESHAKVYLMMYYFSLFDLQIQHLNEKIKVVAVERVKAILEEGRASGKFGVSDPQGVANTIHNLLVGALISYRTSPHAATGTELRERVTHAALELCQVNRRV